MENQPKARIKGISGGMPPVVVTVVGITLFLRLAAALVRPPDTSGQKN